MAPTERLTLRASSMNWTFSPFSIAGAALLDQLDVQRLVQAVVLHVDLVARHVGRHLRLVEHAG
jgi:hypothetical protein